MRAVMTAVLLTAVSASPAVGQAPTPRTPATLAQPQPQQPAPQSPPATRPAPPPAATPAPAPAPQAAPATPGAPNAAALGFPVYPAAQFIASYDAGRGQRYYLYGTAATYAELVNYYRVQLKDKGDEVYKEPPTYMFSIGKYREETMAFPPGVTIKDWTWGGSPGYPNPKLGAKPERYPSIIMIVPAPPAAPTR